LWGALGIAAIGLPLLLSASLGAMLTGLALVGVGTFLAQAAATGFIGKAAPSNRALASGLYLASYFLGGLVGSAVLGQLYVQWGWSACVIGIGVALAVAAALTLLLKAPTDRQSMSRRHGTDRQSAMAGAASLRDGRPSCSFC
jgi:MFS family permease